MTTEPPGDEGSSTRTKREKRSRAAQRFREAARYTMTVLKVCKDVLDLVSFIDRHL